MTWEDTTRIAKKSVVKDKTMYLPKNPVNRAEIRYTGGERSDADGGRCGKKSRQKTKSDRTTRGRKSRPKKCSDPPNSDGSNSDDDPDDRSERKKGRNPCCRTKDLRGVSRRGRDSDLVGSSGVSSAALSEGSNQLSGRKDFYSDDGERRQRTRLRNLSIMSPLNEVFSRGAEYRE